MTEHTSTSTPSPTATAPPASADPGESPPSPAEQAHLVTHLHEHLRVRFAGEGPEHALILDRVPSKVLQLGILPALPQPEPDALETPEQLAQMLQRPPSSMGLDFEIVPVPHGDVELEISASFSVYLQEYPTFDEQREFHHGPEKVLEEEADESHDEGTMRLRPKYRRYDIASGPRPVRLDGELGEVAMPLSDVVDSGLGSALRAPECVYPFVARNNQTLPVSALDSDAAGFQQAIREAEGDARDTAHEPPAVSMVVSWQPADGGRLRVQVTLRNETLQPAVSRRRSRNEPRSLPRELALFNARLRVDPPAGALAQIDFHRAPKDFRYADERRIWTVGRNAHGRRLVADEDPREPLVTETWPVFVQKRMEPRRDAGLTLDFSELADPDRAMGALGRISSAMKDFEVEWEEALAAWSDQASQAECRKALEAFRGDMAAFERGLDCLRRDPRLKQAYCAANEVFDLMSRHKKYRSWRLFQVVYQVIELQALRVRETPDDEALRAELDTADVLWFPTGGGKTEAYLGLIVAALFYDRLRGKARGVTAMLRFPLRMLSVQQLQRLLEAIAVAERVRVRMLQEGQPVGGDPFRLGYWAGADNSPNSLASSWAERPRENIDWWIKTAAEEDDHGDSLRIVTICPQPGCGGKLVLRPDADEVRLRHICESCGEDAPVYITDDEVYRYLPAVIVSTVDKLAHIARAEQFLSILAGPAFRCPDHGYFSWHTAVWPAGARRPSAEDRCIAGAKCTRPASDYERVGPTKDPCPAVLVQDELHLLEEELGTFSSHYETLLKLLQERCGDGLPSKVLAATATIERFEAQVINLYAREARVFPSPGYRLGNSFYVETDDHVARRIYVGALPARPDVEDFGALAQGYLLEEVMRLQDDLPAALAELGWDQNHSPGWLAKLLLDYELTLGYVNRKQDAQKIEAELSRFPRRGLLREDVDIKTLIGGGSGGGTPLAEIADILQRVDEQYAATPPTPRQSRLRAMVATSLISHGVDLNALNLMIVNGMTPTVAGYVQASSRSGRTHVGLVVTGFNRRSARERNFFQFFTETHAFLDRMIAPVPVNRFARFAAGVTAPGIVSALVLHLYGLTRLRALGRPDRPTASLQQIRQARVFLTGTEAPSGPKDDLVANVGRALGVGATVRRRIQGGFATQPLFDPRMAQWLEQEAADQADRQWDILVDPTNTGGVARNLKPEPLTSFRQVDEQMDLNAFTREAEIHGALTGARGQGGS